jgi:hypothetical protein
MIEMADEYDAVNTAWPAEVPTITIEAALKFATRLWKAFAKKEGVRLRRFHRNRRSWGSTERTAARHASGWRCMVHDVSHLMHAAGNPAASAHGRVHADLELRMVRYVVERGWLAPKAKPKPAVDQRAVRYQRTLDAIERWQAKHQRAERALRKLAQRRRYYERTLSL